MTSSDEAPGTLDRCFFAAEVGLDDTLVVEHLVGRATHDELPAVEGHELVRRCLRRGAPGPYQIQAAINAVHADAPIAAATDWQQIAALYGRLLELAPSPVVELNRAVAVAMAAGPEVGLDLLAPLRADPRLAAYPYLHATTADLLLRLGRRAEAAEAYGRALDLTTNTPTECVIDGQHRVFGYQNLFVVDGAAVGANLGVNPSLTITALAERAMSFIPPKRA